MQVLFPHPLTTDLEQQSPHIHALCPRFDKSANALRRGRRSENHCGGRGRKSRNQTSASNTEQSPTAPLRSINRLVTSSVSLIQMQLIRNRMLTLTPRLLSGGCFTSFGLKCFISLNSFNTTKLESCSTKLKIYFYPARRQWNCQQELG